MDKIKLTDLKTAPYNPRQISKGNFKRLCESIENFSDTKSTQGEFRLVDPIIINKKSMTVVGGHQRIAALQELGQDFVVKEDVVFINVEPKREKALNIALNNQNMAGDWDFPKLKDVIVDLDDGEFDMTMTGFHEDELREMFDYEPAGEAGLTDPDAVPEPPKEATTKPGQIFQLGKHLLMCGDSTKWEDVEKLIGEENTKCCITDPPYNVEIDSENWDSKSNSEYLKFSKEWFGIAESLTDVLVFTPGTGRRLENYDLWWSIKKPYWQAIWIKTNAMTHSPIGGFQNYEPIFIYGKPYTKIGQDIFNYPVRIQKDVEDDDGNKTHPTPKQIILWVDLIDKFSNKEDLLYEPFCGSGTTIIGCEKTNRTCYGMELDPIYCDVIIKRWEDFTGGKVELVS